MAVFTKKTSVLLVVPMALLMETTPVVPMPTIAVMTVSELTVNELTAVPPMLTPVAPVKLLPVMVKVATPAQPELGVKELITGDKSLFRITEIVFEL